MWVKWLWVDRKPCNYYINNTSLSPTDCFWNETESCPPTSSFFETVNEFVEKEMADGERHDNDKRKIKERTFD